MPEVFSSASAAERLEAARAFVDRAAPGTEVLIVAASREAADDLARRIIAARGAAFGLHRASLTQLAVRFAAIEMARLGVAPTTALAAEAVAARVSFEADRDGALAYFAPVARFPGFARALAATLAELRLAGLDPTMLARADGPARDVAELLRRFETQLEDGKVADRAALLAIAARVAAEDTLDPVRRMPMVLLDVPIEQPAERAFLAALIAKSPAVLMTVPAGDETALAAAPALAPGGDVASTGTGADITAARGRVGRDGSAQANETVRPATEMLRPRHGRTDSGSGGLASPTAGSSHESDLQRARSFVFSPAAPPARERSGDVRFFSAPGEGRESVEIARQILEEARAGTPFDEMAVLLRTPELYASLLETALRRAGIPAWFARGTSRPDPSGRAFLALLDCALEGLSARRFAEYLSLGQVPPLDAAGAPPADRAVWIAPEDETLGAAADAMLTTSAADAATMLVTSADAAPAPEPDADDRPVVDGTLRAPWKWEQLLVESAVIGGRDRWSRRLAGLEAEYRIRLERLREEDPDSPRTAGVERDLGNLQHLRRFAIPVIERLAALPARASHGSAHVPATAFPGPEVADAPQAGQRAGAVAQSANPDAGLTWGEWIAALELLAPAVLKRPERVLTVLASLRPLDVIGPVTLAEVRDVLAAELTTLAERPPADRYGRVFVGTIEQARGRSFDVVFLPGLAERVFPQKPREDALLLDAVRRRVGARAERDLATLETQDDRSHHERLLLRLAVGAARRRLHLSYSRIEQTEARARVPSFYALEMARALTGRVPDPEAMGREAAAAADARLAWPAPDDPTHAIDEVEHDLATLRALLASGEARGRARYLLEMSDSVARSLRTRWSRWHRKWTPSDGITRITDGTRDALAAARLAARPYSASALQKFASCPYQFFLSAISRIEPRAEVTPVIELDPATRGHLFHRVQADAMRALAAEGRLPLTLEGDALDAARATLDATLNAVAETYRENLAPAIQRVWQDEVESMRADLRMWLEQSAAGHAVWEPLAFELAFGLRRDPANDPRSVEAEVTLPEGYRLRGIVDLIERKRGAPGESEGGVAPFGATDLRVTDYKTGRDYTRRNLMVGGGEMLQPVIYAVAVEQILGARVVESRLYYCTRAGGFSERVVPMSSDARSRGVEVLAIIDRAIAEGFLPAAPRTRACGICDFRDVCGPNEETRITIKDSSRLEDLRLLRDWP